MTFHDRIFLWWNGYCTKHLIEKQSCEDYSWCRSCDKEKSEQREARYKEICRKVREIRRRAPKEEDEVDFLIETIQKVGKLPEWGQDLRPFANTVVWALRDFRKGRI